MNFIEKFDAFLINKCNTGKSGRWSRHKNLKVVLGNALKNNLIKNNPYDEFKIALEEVKTEALNRTELLLLEKIRFSDFPSGKGLNLSRDIFLFTCYTGLRHGDLISLSKKHIQDGENLSLRMHKTKSLVKVPLTHKAKSILKKYTSADNDLIFPYRCNVTVNRDLKKIASLCKIKKNLRVHLGRHTFASIMANDGINAFNIMKLLGHKKINTTQRYVDNSIEDLSRMLSDIKAFN